VNKNIGDRIRKIREEKNVDLKKIADEVGILSTSFSKIERVGTNSVETLIRIANALGVSPKEFFEDKLKSSVKESRSDYGYVTKEEFQNLTGVIHTLIKEVEKLREDIKVKNSNKPRPKETNKSYLKSKKK
jgi:transcriptional regulator with XRE-family HTH domain